MAGLFADKVVIVTGAGGAIGRASARAFAREGARVVVTDINTAGSDETAQAIIDAGGVASSVPGDIAEAAFAEKLVTHAVATYGGLDSAFNNAGVVDERDCLWDEAAFRRTIDINLTAIMLGMKHQIPALLARGGGTIVNTASTSGLVSQSEPALPAYTSSKHGVIGLTKTAALQYARQNIRANAVCPGTTRTAMVEQVMASSESVKQRLLSMAPMGRLAEPEEIAEVVIWLASPLSSYVTAQAIAADGGFTSQ